MTLIIAATAIFISTSIDDLVLLLFFHSMADTKGKRLSILFGSLIGIGCLVAIGMVGAYFAQKMLEPWALGLLGLVPIALGIRMIVGPEAEEGSEGVAASRSLLITVTLLTIASGGDNLGLYIPWFATLETGAMTVVLLVFFICCVLFWSMAGLLANQKHIKLLLTRFSRLLVPLVYLVLGATILFESGTIEKFVSLFT